MFSYLILCNDGNWKFAEELGQEQMNFFEPSSSGIHLMRAQVTTHSVPALSRLPS